MSVNLIELTVLAFTCVRGRVLVCFFFFYTKVSKTGKSSIKISAL